MRVIEQYVEILGGFHAEDALWRIEEAARNCYKSEGKNAERSVAKRDALIRHVVKRGHTSVLEHITVPMRIVTDRGVSHEWVRHRIGWSYSQESTRYCNYGHSEGIEVIRPHWMTRTEFYQISNEQIESIPHRFVAWYRAVSVAEQSYLDMLTDGCRPEEARDVLPNCLKTEIVATANLVALRHFFNKRCAKDAHPKIRSLALQLLAELYQRMPIVFGDQKKEFIGEDASASSISFAV